MFVFPYCKILNYKKNFLVINSMNFQCMCFIFFKQFQLYLRKLLKVILFVGVGFFFRFFFKKEKRVAVAKLTLVVEESFPFLTNYL